MGNLVDSPPIEAEEPSTDFVDSESEHSEVDIIIDLDAPEYHEYLEAKRKSLSEGALLDDISYLQWKKNNNGLDEQQRITDTKHRSGHKEVAKRRNSTPITGNEILAVNENSQEYEKRAMDSKQRIGDIRKKYNLKNRDYNARTYVWNEQDEKQAKLERQQRKLLRQQIRLKYNLPTPKTSRTTVIASG